MIPITLNLPDCIAFLLAQFETLSARYNVPRRVFGLEGNPHDAWREVVSADEKAGPDLDAAVQTFVRTGEWPPLREPSVSSSTWPNVGTTNHLQARISFAVHTLAGWIDQGFISTTPNIPGVPLITDTGPFLAWLLCDHWRSGREQFFHDFIYRHGAKLDGVDPDKPES